ncbi:uncharacterized protein Z520_10996 [Fonsecaea multimorphosa CBS 102226]|uniref:CENP-V/GFA domain-containing protein n=1 Tax=Fonsecaea multimorphosa CBS 102226 TaxID=1442371 RepID=A0A0D2KAC3_9EURO|nr:uncharacterized protein Z520_10996 [Fonsecaea multimorphosa CBS 102226]KIX93353.1 hypothetical protein Z520_10996 [Fonsecaea multimorphosa CBS 102226]
MTALCHCTDCQKWAGSAFSTNVAVPTSNFSLTKGTPKAWQRLAVVSGKPNYHFFCGDCGSNLYAQPQGMAGLTLIKAGSLEQTNISIVAELFVTRRRDYISPVPGAQQLDQMP